MLLLSYLVEFSLQMDANLNAYLSSEYSTYKYRNLFQKLMIMLHFKRGKWLSHLMKDMRAGQQYL